MAKTGLHNSGAPFDPVDYVSYGGAKNVCFLGVKLSACRPPDNQNLKMASGFLLNFLAPGLRGCVSCTSNFLCSVGFGKKNMAPSLKRLQKIKLTGNFEDIYFSFTSSALNDSCRLIKGNSWCTRNL